MCEVVRAVTRDELKRFFDFSLECGYTQKEAEYIVRYSAPVLNPIHTDKRVYLMAISGGKVIGRLLTWKDDLRDSYTGENCGFFSLCDMLSEECKILFDEMMKLQRIWGSRVLRGPVAPDGSGFFNGLCTGNGKDVFCSPSMPVNLPELYGFNIYSTERSFDVSIPEENVFAKLADVSRKRFNVVACPMHKRLFSDPLTKSVAELTAQNLLPAAARQAERIAPFIDRECSFYADDPRGVCSGYILTFAGDIPRVATLITGNGCFSPAVCYALLDSAHKALLKKGIKRVTAGVIDTENLRSLRLTQNKWCVPAREYRVYQTDII